MPNCGGDVGSINHLEESIIIFSSSTTKTNMMKRQVVVRRSSSLDQNNHSSPTTTSSFTLRTVRYLECQKNHAAAIGGYAVDGCREFMATGEEGTSDALTCAACGCHRNFHRREVEAEVVCESCSSPPPSHAT